MDAERTLAFESTDERPARRRVPELALPPLVGAAAPLRAHRLGSALLLLGEALGTDDVRWLREVERELPTLAASSGRVVAIVPAASDALRSRLGELGLSFPVLVDDEGQVARAAGARAPAVVITDQYGEVYAAMSAAAPSGWMAVEEIDRWLGYLSIRCGG